MAAIAIAAFVGKETYATYASVENDLLSQNVEALADETEEGMIVENELVRCIGSERWLDSFIRFGYVTTIEHYIDTLDKRRIYEVSQCCAKHKNNEGPFQGNNYIKNYRFTGNEKQITCLGFNNHRELEDALDEFYYNNEDI